MSGIENLSTTDWLALLAMSGVVLALVVAGIVGAYHLPIYAGPRTRLAGTLGIGGAVAALVLFVGVPLVALPLVASALGVSP